MGIGFFIEALSMGHRLISEDVGLCKDTATSKEPPGLYIKEKRAIEARITGARVT